MGFTWEFIIFKRNKGYDVRFIYPNEMCRLLFFLFWVQQFFLFHSLKGWMLSSRLICNCVSVRYAFLSMSLSRVHVEVIFGAWNYIHSVWSKLEVIFLASIRENYSSPVCGQFSLMIYSILSFWRKCKVRKKRKEKSSCSLMFIVVFVPLHS